MTLYISDLDGTLLRSDMSMSEYSVKTLNSLAERGAMFSYATARSFASAFPLVKKLRPVCPAVIFNGVFVIDARTGKHIIENTYSEECMRLAREVFVSEGIAPLVYSYIDGEERVSYMEGRIDDVRSYVDARRGDKRLRPVSGYGELFEGDIFYFTVIDPRDTRTLDKVFNAENGFSRNIQKDTYDDMIWYEIYDRSASKANAVRQLAELVCADELVCFGDNFNDISMIKAADIGAAVENAADEVKRAADVIIGSNNDDGVARFIDSRER